MKPLVPILALALIAGAFAAVQTLASAPGDTSASDIGFELREIALGKTLPAFVEQTLVVSPDGRRIAYVVGDADSRNFPDPAPPWQPVTIIMAQKKGELRAVVDGVPGKPYPGVGVPVFSPDGKRVAYSAQRKTLGILFGQYVVVDGAEGKVFLAVGHPVFSPDGRHIAYRAQDTHKHWRAIVDGTEGDKYDMISTDPVFSPDNTRVAYVGWRNKKAFLVNGADVAAPLVAEGAGDPTFSPDGRRLAYKVNRGAGFFVIVDGHEGPVYDRIGLPVFTPNGRLTYAARSGGKSFIVTEGSRIEEHADHRQVGDPVLSADGRRVAYWANDGSKERIVLEGVVGDPYDEIGRLAFDPTGRRFAYEARLGSVWRLVVDGVQGPEYQPVKGFAVERDWRQLYRSAWVFERPDLVRYVTVRDGEIVRLEVQLKPH